MVGIWKVWMGAEESIQGLGWFEKRPEVGVFTVSTE